MEKTISHVTVAGVYSRSQCKSRLLGLGRGMRSTEIHSRKKKKTEQECLNWDMKSTFKVVFPMKVSDIKMWKDNNEKRGRLIKLSKVSGSATFFRELICGESKLLANPEPCCLSLSGSLWGYVSSEIYRSWPPSLPLCGSVQLSPALIYSTAVTSFHQSHVRRLIPLCCMA